MSSSTLLLFVLQLLIVLGWVRSTCVFNSDFGFTLNCGFKKSSLFRVRNLGGVKGYVGLGFSVGDDLGFAQSLTNTDDTDRRRSTSNNGGYQESQEELKRTDVATGRSHSGGSRSPYVAWAGALPGSAGGPPLPGTAGAIPGTAGVVPPFRPLAEGANSKDAAVPPFSALPPSIARIPVVRPQPIAPLIYQNSLQMANRRFQIILPNTTDTDGIKNTVVVGSVEKVPSPLVEVAAPSVGAAQTAAKNIYSAGLTKRLQSALHHPAKTSSELAGVDIASPSPLLMGHSIQSLSQASNISVEALAAALRLREQQLSTSTLATTVTPTTTTAPRPTKPATVRPKYPLVGPNRVMNAPKEYYPVSYDQNYDDNFTSKVELPDTSFTCGDQKHFPGLYADEDLGCMVFHVCAFTDDGMVMKSFLCPESTLFDQSILKCNWWFYVDCKASRRLYDSNIPISKSYQLMKALAFFSGYKNQTGTSTNTT